MGVGGGREEKLLVIGYQTKVFGKSGRGILGGRGIMGTGEQTSGCPAPITDNQ